MSDPRGPKYFRARGYDNIADQLEKDIANHPWTDEDQQRLSASRRKSIARNKEAPSTASKGTDNEMLLLLRKQEERHQQSITSRRTFAKWIAGAGFAVLLVMLIANGSTPDTTGEWLPDSGTYLAVSIALFVIAAIVGGTAHD